MLWDSGENAPESLFSTKEKNKVESKPKSKQSDACCYNCGCNNHTSENCNNKKRVRCVSVVIGRATNPLIAINQKIWKFTNEYPQVNIITSSQNLKRKEVKHHSLNLISLIYKDIQRTIIIKKE